MITVKGRILQIPSVENQIGFEGDNAVEARQFEITDTSLFDLNFKLDLKGGNEVGIIDLEKTVEADRIILTWEILKEHLPSGVLYIQLRAFDGVEIWHSEKGILYVGDSINATDYFPSPLPSEFEQIEQRVTEKHTEVIAAAEQVGEDKTAVNTALNTFADTTYPNAVQAVTGEGTKQIGLVIAEGDTQVERVQTEGAAQVSLAEGYAQTASAKAQQATEERERIEDLDVYTKKETDNTFSNALIGTANGETIELTDIQPNTDFRSVVLKGETKEIGTGDKSPDNPYALQGVENPVVAVSGKNRWGGELENGYIDSETGINQGWGGYKRSGYIPMPSNTGYVFACNKPETGTFFAIYYDKNKNYISSHNLVISTSPIKRTTPLGTAYIRITGVVAIMDNLGDKAQLELGTTATPYEPFQGYDEYPITTPPLYSLPNGVADEVDLVSGEGVKRIGIKVLDGTESWQKYRELLWTENKIGVALYSITPTATASTGELCTHFHRALVTGESGFVATANGFRAISPGFYFAITISGITDIESWQSFLAAQHAAGTPVTVQYKLETPEPFTIDPINIPPYSPTSIISTDQGSLEVEYNRDINKVLADLQAQIIVFDEPTESEE